MERSIILVLLILFLFLVFCSGFGFGFDFDQEDSNRSIDGGRWCHCWNETIVADEEDENNGIECRCFGKLLDKLPKKLPRNLEKLIISDAVIQVLKRNSLQPYKKTLRDLTLNNLQNLFMIEAGIFRNIQHLRSLYISHAPLLKLLPGLFDGISSKKFLSLRIMHTSLEQIPDLSYIKQSFILHMIDFEDNKFSSIPTNSIRIKAEQVILNYNQIIAIDAFAFNGSQIAKLNLKGNKLLTHLDENAFIGLNSLIELDLSGTNIQNLPTQGLNDIEVLRIQDTKSLKIIPSVYNFRSLKVAWLTYPFHCCAFKYPAQHDPIQYALHIQRMQQFCQNGSQTTIRTKRRIDSFANSKHLQRNINMDWFEDDSYYNHFRFLSNNHNDNLSTLLLDTIRGKQIGSIYDDDESKLEQENDFGTFHQTWIENPGADDIQAVCGNISQSVPSILCYPKPDALNPCEDIMGSYWLRVSVWFVVITAFIGNLAVIVIFLTTLSDINVPKFLMCHLACADICMGLYLLLIASMDLHSMGFYFNFAFDWQMGSGCRVAGFLTVFSSQLSVFTLTIITLERWCAIRFAIYLNRRIRLGAAIKIMIFGWLYSILMALLPLFGISNYSSTSICLPMEVRDPQDMAYLLTLLLLNSVAFVVIVVCYMQIYFSLDQETRHCSTNNELTIAKKMAMLIFTDFACWAPTAFFGITAIFGYPLIDVTRSKILLVFFYPLNSCANPYLYAILTAQYRRDFFMLLYRCGICKRTIKQYTMSSSLPTNNQSNLPLSLLLRSNGRKFSDKSTTNVDEAIV